MMHAIIHTKGVLLNKIYVPLELAYHDFTGEICHFHIQSPMTYSAMRKFFPNARPDVYVTTTDGTPHPNVLGFLKTRQTYLRSLLPSEVPVVFGYKGENFQPQILKEAGIENIVNVETFGVPPLDRHVQPSSVCHLHKGNLNKCALVALKQIASHFVR